MVHVRLGVLHEVHVRAAPLHQEVVLHARVVEGDRYDLEVCTGINLEQRLHEVLLRDNVEHLVHQVLPLLHLVVALREPLSQKSQPDDPEQLVSNVDSRLLVYLTKLHIGLEILQVGELLFINQHSVSVGNVHLLVFCELEVEGPQLVQSDADAVIASIVDGQVEVPSRQLLVLAEVEQRGLVLGAAAVEAEVHNDLFEAFCGGLGRAELAT